MLNELNILAYDFLIILVGFLIHEMSRVVPGKILGIESGVNGSLKECKMRYIEVKAILTQTTGGSFEIFLACGLDILENNLILFRSELGLHRLSKG